MNRPIPNGFAGLSDDARALLASAGIHSLIDLANAELALPGLPDADFTRARLAAMRALATEAAGLPAPTAPKPLRQRPLDLGLSIAERVRALDEPLRLCRRRLHRVTVERQRRKARQQIKRLRLTLARVATQSAADGLEPHAFDTLARILDTADGAALRFLHERPSARSAKDLRATLRDARKQLQGLLPPRVPAPSPA